MNATMKQHSWAAFLKLFTEQNRNRPTRLGVFELRDGGEIIDYWIESGLPLTGIDLDEKGVNGLPDIQILLGDRTQMDPSLNMTHRVNAVRSVKFVLGCDGTADGLEILDAERNTSVLRFEA